tara:strand:+ start:940 stop:1416 length:477 start_codon:yes stop_codon:yes gene_type:complete
MKLINKEIKKWLFSKFNKYNDMKNIDLFNEYIKLIYKWLKDNDLEFYDFNLFRIKFYLFMYDDKYFYNYLIDDKENLTFNEFYMKYLDDINEIFIKINEISSNNGNLFNKDNKFTYHLIQFIYNEINKNNYNDDYDYDYEYENLNYNNYDNNYHNYYK